jgi:hypothetical protein
VGRRLAARFVDGGAARGRELGALGAVSPGAAVLALALPLLFLHRVYQPSVDVALAGTSATAYLSDFAVAAVVVAAALTALRGGLPSLRLGRPLWIAGALFFVWIAVEVAYGGAHPDSYARSTHAVTAAKFAEYALLAPAVVLLVRRRADVAAVLWALALCCAAATIVALAQFFGANVALAVFVGQREASFLGYSDYSALSVVVGLAGILALTAPSPGLGRRFGAVALAAGGLGTILAGALAGVLGFATGAVVLAGVVSYRHGPVRRTLVVAGVSALVVALGAVAIRGNDLQAFARFTGASTAVHHGRAKDVQTYSQRSLLSWIGYRIWRSHPLVGVGWEGSAEPASFEPVLPAARLRFPTLAAQAFPADLPGRHYGVQNSWVQALADLGVVGFVLWASLFVAAAWASRSTR